jgi:hypothetical protein
MSTFKICGFHILMTDADKTVPGDRALLGIKLRGSHLISRERGVFPGPGPSAISFSHRTTYMHKISAKSLGMISSSMKHTYK